jgi:prepilin-type N-terminal cleavage/methylation domain-containing protein
MRRRHGFTLVELLVAMALIVLIMSILSSAFVEGIESFRHLKGVGDLQESLRTATIPLRTDLAAPHVTDLTVGAKRLSEPFTVAPIEGFFRIQGSPPGNFYHVDEGADSDQIHSFRATDHVLHMMVQLTGQRREQWLSARIPRSSTTPQTAPLEALGPPGYARVDSGLLWSQDAEVAYFLYPMREDHSLPFDYAGNTNPQLQTSGQPLPLFTLHRRQKLVLPIPTATAIPFTSRNQFAEASTSPTANGTFIDFNLPAHLINPARRSIPVPANVATPDPLQAAPHRFVPVGLIGRGVLAGYNASLYGEDPAYARVNDDLLMTNVLSFEIKVLRQGQFGQGRFDFEDVATAFAALPDRAYDTATVPPASLQLKAIKITMRVWDSKTEQTRQVSMIQDL